MQQSRVTDEQAARNLRRYIKKHKAQQGKPHASQEKFTKNRRFAFSIGARIPMETFNQLQRMVCR